MTSQGGLKQISISLLLKKRRAVVLPPVSVPGSWPKLLTRNTSQASRFFDHIETQFSFIKWLKTSLGGMAELASWITRTQQLTQTRCGAPHRGDEAPPLCPTSSKVLIHITQLETVLKDNQLSYQRKADVCYFSFSLNVAERYFNCWQLWYSCKSKKNYIAYLLLFGNVQSWKNEGDNFWEASGF